MQRLSLFAAAAVVLISTHAVTLRSQAKPAPSAAPGTTLVLTTAKGVIEIELFSAEAPQSVSHVLALVKRNFYRGQRFHWAQPGVVQFGDVQSRDMTKQADWGRGGSGPMNALDPIGVAEVGKRPFVRGSVGYAYRPNQTAIHADAQMFILTAPNPALNGKYAQLGRVSQGMAVVDKIAREDVIKDVSVK